MAPRLKINDIQSIVADLGKQYGAERIYLFGSYARGDATFDSDVDLLTSDSLDDDFLNRIRTEEVLLYASE